MPAPRKSHTFTPIEYVAACAEYLVELSSRHFTVSDHSVAPDCETLTYSWQVANVTMLVGVLVKDGDISYGLQVVPKDGNQLGYYCKGVKPFSDNDLINAAALFNSYNFSVECGINAAKNIQIQQSHEPNQSGEPRVRKYPATD